MTNKYKKEIEDINRRVYGNMRIKRLKDIAKGKHGLLNVDHYTKANKNELVERLVKGKQLEDENKNTILKYGQDQGLKLNASSSKKTLIEKIRNPKLEDLNNKRLRNLADKGGVPLRSQMTDGQIIQRLRNPDAYYNKTSLGRLARNNNIEFPRNISLQGLKNILIERDLITTTPITAQETNLWVSAKNIPEALRRVAKKKARNAREAVADFKNYIKNLNKDYITPARLKKLSRQLEKKIKKAVGEEKEIFKPIKEKEAFNGNALNYVINGNPFYGPVDFLRAAKPSMVNIMNNNHNTKVKLFFFVTMERINLSPEGLKYPQKEFKFHSRGKKIITEATDTIEIYHEMISEILEAMLKVEQADGSGWAFMGVIRLILKIDKWDPLKASSYIDLPPELKNKKALINMKNTDNKCFLWSVLRGLNPKDKDAGRIDKDLKSKENTLNMEGIDYPVNIKGHIKRFEKQNPDISVSVLGYSKDEKIYPLRRSKHAMKNKRKYNIILLLIKDGDNSHYCLVKDESALLSSQVNKRKGKLYFCLNCLNGFDTPEKLENHKKYCEEEESVKITMPPPNTFINFKNFVHSEKAPFAIYADFESVLKPLDNCNPDPNRSYTKKYNKHEAVSFVYYIKSFNESVYKSKLRSYVREKEEDPDTTETFIKWLEEDVKIIANLGNKPMDITPEVEEQFKQASNCWICGNLLNSQDRVRDHCHFTGRYRGAAHNRCNL